MTHQSFIMLVLAEALNTLTSYSSQSFTQWWTLNGWEPSEIAIFALTVGLVGPVALSVIFFFLTRMSLDCSMTICFQSRRTKRLLGESDLLISLLYAVPESPSATHSKPKPGTSGVRGQCETSVACCHRDRFYVPCACGTWVARQVGNKGLFVCVCDSFGSSTLYFCFGSSTCQLACSLAHHVCIWLCACFCLAYCVLRLGLNHLPTTVR